MPKTTEERIAELKARKDKIATRLTALEAKAKQDDRKLDTRRKIVVGAAVIAHMEHDAAFAAIVKRVLKQNVLREQDKAALGPLLDTVPTPSPAPPMPSADPWMRPAGPA